MLEIFCGLICEVAEGSDGNSPVEVTVFLGGFQLVLGVVAWLDRRCNHNWSVKEVSDLVLCVAGDGGDDCKRDKCTGASVVSPLSIDIEPDRLAEHIKR